MTASGTFLQIQIFGLESVMYYVCLETEVSPCLDVLILASALFSPRGYSLGLASVSSLLPCLDSRHRLEISMLHYGIIIHNFHPFILFIFVFQLHDAGAIMVVIKIDIAVSCHTILSICDM